MIKLVCTYTINLGTAFSDKRKRKVKTRSKHVALKLIKMLSKDGFEVKTNIKNRVLSIEGYK